MEKMTDEVSTPENAEPTHEWVEPKEIPVWYPKREGDRRTGTFVKTQTLVGEYGPYFSVVFRDGEGLYRVNGYFLMMKFADANPVPGDVIRLVYTGVEPTARSYLMRTYRVFVRRTVWDDTKTPAEPAE